MFSVIIPLFNKEHTILETLNSVFDQTFQEFEVLIINDGSTDDGISVINTNFDDKRLKIVNQTNKGVSTARNNGVKQAKYEYLAFLDGDDLWEVNYLETVAKAIQKYPKAGMFCVGGNVRNSDGSRSLRLAKKYRGQILKINFFENPHVFVHTSAMIIKKFSFNKTSGFPKELIRNEDYALSYSLALIVPVVYIGIPLSTYVGGVPGQATSVNSYLLLKQIATRHKITYNQWENTGKKNALYIIFLKYELRHEFLGFIRNKKTSLLKEYFDLLGGEILSIFSKKELFIYKNNSLLSYCIILFTKILWRRRGFPRIGEL